MCNEKQKTQMKKKMSKYELKKLAFKNSYTFKSPWNINHQQMGNKYFGRRLIVPI
jgi:hypothetical protein